MMRTDGSLAAIADSAANVPSMLPSSTKTISDGAPIIVNTAARRRCSSWSVASSLKSGITTDRRTGGFMRRFTSGIGVFGCGTAASIVARQHDAGMLHDRVRGRVDQQFDFLRALRAQSRADAVEHGIRIARMRHQLARALGHRFEQRAERLAREQAGQRAPEERRR